jgi:phosphatidylglycerophosphate synthase
MPSSLRVRKIFGPLVKAIARGLSKIGITPNIATYVMLFFALLSLISLGFLKNLLLFSIFVFTTGIFDGVDGAIARLTDKSTKSGAFLDSTMDRVSEFIVLLGLLIYCWNESIFLIDMKLIVVISLFSSLMISYSRARAENFFKGDFDIGLMARSERLFYLVITSIIAHFFGLMNEFLFIFMWLVICTAVWRFFKFNNIIKKNENES